MVMGVGDDGAAAEVLDVARRYLGAIEVADVDAARACFHPEARIWHNFDDATQSVEENLALMSWMAGRFPDRSYHVHRLEPIAGGYLQQHTLQVATPAGLRARTEAAAIVTVDDGLIVRIDEYIDPTPLLQLLDDRPRS